MNKKDKEKVFGGSLSQDQLELCIVKENYDGDDKDYLSLIKAYRHSVPENFTQFVDFFKQQGMNLNAKSAKGETALETISQHEKSEEYVVILKSV